MSTEIQQLTPFDDFGMPAESGNHAGGGGMPQQDQPKKPGMVQNVHRSLRGKYWFVIPLSLVGGMVGAYFGWKSQKPMYKSEGAIQVKSALLTPFATQSQYVQPINMYDEYMMTQVSIMTSRRAIDAALKDAAWLDTGRGNDWGTVQVFHDSLVVEHPSRTQMLHVSFTDRDPGVAAAGVKAIITAYNKLYNATDSQAEGRALDILSAKKLELLGMISNERKDIDRIAQQYGAENLEGLYQAKVSMVNDLEGKLNTTKLQLRLLESRTDPVKTIDSYTLYQIGMLDPIMREKLSARSAAQNQLQGLTANYGPKNAKVLELTRTVESLSNDVEQYSKEWKDLQKKIALAGSAQGAIVMSIESMTKELETLQTTYNSVHEAMVTLGNNHLAMQRSQEKVRDLVADIRGLEKQMDQIKSERGIGSRLTIISDGEIPMGPFKDKRKTMALAGGAGAGAAPVLLAFLMGFLNRRYRYSDEAESGVGMPPLLGILPTLPDRLSDPEQAAIAAHCIHQIRIMLQVNAQPENKKVYMITSASTGDGKTSLTMALGLSFAASGSRTLVIDCDMVGQGLTHRLKARQSPGLLEALGAASLSGKVKKTTTPNLFVLPIGGADSAHAGSLSPNTMRKLLTEAKKIFDVVLIDTGPILGSLEAASVGAAADTVILAIARGQHQGLVERSVRQLRSVGAHISGVVFNRAEKRDFQRSVGSSSIRSISAVPQPQRLLIGEGEEPSRFGPLARSVASFMPGHDAMSREHAPAAAKGDAKSDAPARNGDEA